MTRDKSLGAVFMGREIIQYVVFFNQTSTWTSTWTEDYEHTMGFISSACDWENSNSWRMYDVKCTLFGLQSLTLVKFRTNPWSWRLADLFLASSDSTGRPDNSCPPASRTASVLRWTKNCNPRLPLPPNYPLGVGRTRRAFCSLFEAISGSKHGINCHIIVTGVHHLLSPSFRSAQSVLSDVWPALILPFSVLAHVSSRSGLGFFLNIIIHKLN